MTMLASFLASSHALALGLHPEKLRTSPAKVAACFPRRRPEISLSFLQMEELSLLLLLLLLKESLSIWRRSLLPPHIAS